MIYKQMKIKQTKVQRTKYLRQNPPVGKGEEKILMSQDLGAKCGEYESLAFRSVLNIPQ